MSLKLTMPQRAGASPVVHLVKNLPFTRDTGEEGLIPKLGRSPWRRKWQATAAFLPGESHAQRSLVGYLPSVGVRGSWT